MSVELKTKEQANGQQSEAKKPKPEWQMPRPAIGDIVLWYPTTSHDVPMPAIVTEVNPRSIAVNVFNKDWFNTMCKDGCRFRGDPDLNIIEANDVGTWEFTERHKEMELLKKQLAELVA